MSRTASPALPRWSISRAAVAIRYSRRFWPPPSPRRTAGFLGDIAPECSDDGGSGECRGVPEQHQSAGPLREQPARCGNARPVEGLAGVERQPAREPRPGNLPDDALDQGNPGQRDGDGSNDVADERADADADDGE